VKPSLLVISAALLSTVSTAALAQLAPAGAIPDAARAEAKTIYDQRCTTCHGATGRGDGAAAVALNPKPRDFSDKAWQTGAKDDYLMKIVLEGGPAVGKSPLMPPNPDLQAKPQVVAALREMIRKFGAAR
jgi:mono/diheme cytochrome c family protein